MTGAPQTLEDISAIAEGSVKAKQEPFEVLVDQTISDPHLTKSMPISQLTRLLSLMILLVRKLVVAT